MVRDGAAEADREYVPVQVVPVTRISRASCGPQTHRNIPSTPRAGGTDPSPPVSGQLVVERKPITMDARITIDVGWLRIPAM